MQNRCWHRRINDFNKRSKVQVQSFLRSDSCIKKEHQKVIFSQNLGQASPGGSGQASPGGCPATVGQVAPAAAPFGGTAPAGGFFY